MNPLRGPESPAANTVDTIVAISTPPGRGGIGIVRLSGPQSVAIANQIVRLRNPLAHAQARFAEVVDPDVGRALESVAQGTVDQAIVTWFAAPNSYSGEDLVEIAAHGSPVVLAFLVRQALFCGATLAEPGEFTQRAFLSGRIDLTQAEAVRDLIEAQTLHQVRVAARQLGGALSRRVSPIKQSLAELIALLEAGIDFAEDDIDVAPAADILLRIGSIREELLPISASFAQGRIVHDGLTLAIVGRPNVGKSSLFNRLVERERAIVTASPGTTRDLVTERVSLGGIPVELVDTAGLREAADEAESLGIAKSREALAEADIVLVVVDATRSVSEEETELIRSLIGRGVIVVSNKSDLLGAAGARDEGATELWRASVDSPHKRTESPEDRPPAYHSPTELRRGIRTSAVSGEGIAELREEILRLVRGAGGDEAAGMLTNLRQHQAVTGSLESLSAAADALERETPHEMVLLDLYSALRHLDSLTGETTSDDILNMIFSTFCIGK